MKFKSAITSVIALTAALSLSACASSTASASTAASTSVASTAAVSAQVSGSVTASGSSALLPLVQEAANEYMNVNPNVSVTTNGGGSGTGLQQVSDGTVDIGDSDVPAEEKIDASLAAELVDHEVAFITVAAITNTELGVTNLTTDQLVGIFTGTITNWSEVGGPDLDIMLVTRPSSSGTRALFKQYALNGAEEASNEALETDDSGTLMQTVQDNVGAIGYVALPYIINSTAVQAVSIDGVEPTLANTCSGDYKVWGYEHMYTKGEGSEAAQDFIKYILGSDFAAKSESIGYGVVSKLSSAAVESHQ